MKKMHAMVINEGVFKGAVVGKTDGELLSVIRCDEPDPAQCNYDFETGEYSPKPEVPVVVPETIEVNKPLVLKGIPEHARYFIGNHEDDDYNGGDLEVTIQVIGPLRIEVRHPWYQRFERDVLVVDEPEAIDAEE